MRKVTLFASFVICLAEHCLRTKGMQGGYENGEDTCLVASRDISAKIWTLRKLVGKS